MPSLPLSPSGLPTGLRSLITKRDVERIGLPNVVEAAVRELACTSLACIRERPSLALPQNVRDHVREIDDPKTRPFTIGRWRGLLAAAVDTLPGGRVVEEALIRLVHRLGGGGLDRLVEARNRFTHGCAETSRPLLEAAAAELRATVDLEWSTPEVYQGLRDLWDAIPRREDTELTDSPELHLPRPAVEFFSALLQQGAANPFRRLEAFGEEDFRLYGKCVDSQQLDEWVAWGQAPAESGERVRLLYGLSGCGKTSFIQAGLSPRLKRLDEVDTETQERLGQSVRYFTAGDELPETLARGRDDLLRIGQGPLPALLVVDQLERIFELKTNDRGALGRELSQLLADAPALKLVMVTRHDALANCEQWARAHLPCTDGLTRLLPMPPRSQLRRAIQALWKSAGIELSDGAANALLADLADLRETPPGNDLSSPGHDPTRALDAGLQPALVQIGCHSAFRRFRNSPGAASTRLTNDEMHALVLGENQTSVSPDAPRKRAASTLIREYLTEVLSEHSEVLSDGDREAAREVLSALVQRVGSWVQLRARTAEDIAQDVDRDRKTVRRVLRGLERHRLVRQRSERYVIIHDRLGWEISQNLWNTFDELASAVSRTLQTAGQIVRSAENSSESERVVTGLFADISAQLLARRDELAAGDLLRLRERAAEQSVRLLDLRAHGSTADGHGSKCAIDEAVALFALLSDHLFLLAEIVGFPRGACGLARALDSHLDRGSELSHLPGTAPARDRAKRWLRRTAPTKGVGLFSPPKGDGRVELTWLAGLHETAGADREIVKTILRHAQLEADHERDALLDYAVAVQGHQRLKDGAVLPASRMGLWRALLFLLRCRPCVRCPAVADDDRQGALEALLAFDWSFDPSADLLEDFGVREDNRTYQGLIVHVPAGPHAMRNQRVARELLIRTAAIERRSRKASPGFHEADQGYMVDHYGEVVDTVKRLVINQAPLLRSPDTRAWVLFEAQEYDQDELLRDLTEAISAVRSSASLEGDIFVDPVAAVANRKDLTRALAARYGIPQPEFRVVAPERYETPWSSIWSRDIAQPQGRLSSAQGLTPGNALDESGEDWRKAVRRAANTIGGETMVKPAVTEFLKGASPIRPGDDADGPVFRRIWSRFRGHLPQHPAVVESLERPICEILTTVTARGRNGSAEGYVDVPPVFYDCLALELDGERGNPFPFHRCWTARNLTDDVLGRAADTVGDAALLTRAALEAKRLSVKLAEGLWEEVARGTHTGCRGVHNRFLACEWLVMADGRVLLNEIKPTQLDKGIITHFYASHSDSDLLVRNLFGLPLPARVYQTSERAVAFIGMVLTKQVARAEDGTPRLLTGFDHAGIRRATAGGAHTTLYPDKMRSRPYRGRIFGAVAFEEDTVQAAFERWASIERDDLVPMWAAT